MPTNTKRSAYAAVLALFTHGCGDDVGSARAEQSDGGAIAASNDASTGASSGGGDSGSAKSQAVDEEFFPGDQANTGVIGFSYPVGGSLGRPSLVAHFTKVQGRRSCDLELLSDECALHKCRVDALGNPTLDGHSYAAAGTIAVAGGDPPFALEIAPNGNEYPQGTATPVAGAFNRSTTLRIRAAGGEVPALDFPWELPLVLLLDSPVATGAGREAKATLENGRDAELKFSRGATDVQLVVASGTFMKDGVRIALDCHFPSAAGVARIPAAALSILPTGYELYPTTVRKTKVKQGAFETTIGLVVDMFTPDRKQVVTFARK